MKLAPVLSQSICLASPFFKVEKNLDEKYSKILEVGDFCQSRMTSSDPASDLHLNEMLDHVSKKYLTGGRSSEVGF